jgi:hypothetical protein
VVRGDPEVVEDGCDSYLLELDAVVCDGEAQLHNPVHVVPIREVVPQLRRVIVQNLFHGRGTR